MFPIILVFILKESVDQSDNPTSRRNMRRSWQLSGYEISAAIHCKPLQLFVRQQSTSAANADERDVSLSTENGCCCL